jgi:poly(A) polymerase
MTARPQDRAVQVLLHHEAVRALAEVAAELGVDSHLVGGILRDRFLGLPSRDLDAVVSGRGREVGERLAERLGARLVDLGGKDFGAYRLVASSWVLDLWDREGTSLESDLARRDFTVDSIALALDEPGRGAVIDPHHGMADLRHRVLRATTPESFRSDPLRVLRLPRLLVQLPGFTVDSGTLELARASAADLVAVASERVRSELGLLFAQPEVARGAAVLAALDLYPGLWLGRPGEPVPEQREIGRLYGQLARLGPTAIRLRELSAGGAGGRRGRPLGHPVDHRIARIALTFAHLPGRDRRAPGAAPGLGRAEALARFAEVGYLTRADAGAVARLLPVERLPADDLERRRFLHRLGELASTAVCYAGALAGSGPGNDPDGRAAWEEGATALARLYRTEGEAIMTPPRLLDGRQVSALLGVGEGPEVGEALRALRWAQVEGRVRTRGEAEDFVRDSAAVRSAGP